MLRIISVLFVLFLPMAALAQQRILPGDIKKINVFDMEWSPTGVNRLTYFELVPGNDDWACYQTKQKYTSNLAANKDSDYFKNANTDKRRFIKKVSVATIGLLIRSVASIKPKLNLKDLNISTKLVVDSGVAIYKRSYNYDPAYDKIFIKELNKPGNIKSAMKFLLFKDNWTDDYPTCVIEIIKRNQDTVKIISRRQMDFMQPWTINNLATFDLDINRFFVAVIGDYRYSNRSRLSGAQMPAKIYDYIYENFTAGKITDYQWRRKNPDNYKAVMADFDWVHQRGIILHPKKLPRNFYLMASIDINDKIAVNNLITFGDTVLRAFKHANFVFDYYKNRKKETVQFRFLDAEGFKYRSSPYSGRNYFNDWLALPENQVYRKKDIIRFDIVRENRRIETWLIMPDNKLVLVGYENNRVAGVTDERIKKYDFVVDDCVIVFESKGKMLSNYFQPPD